MPKHGENPDSVLEGGDKMRSKKFIAALRDGIDSAVKFMQIDNRHSRRECLCWIFGGPGRKHPRSVYLSMASVVTSQKLGKPKTKRAMINRVNQMALLAVEEVHASKK